MFSWRARRPATVSPDKLRAREPFDHARCAGTCGQLVAYPLQLVRTRLQAQGIPGMRKYDGMVDCFRKTIAAGGVRALYAGLGPNFLKALPAISISYVVFEKSKLAILENAGLRHAPR